MERAGNFEPFLLRGILALYYLVISRITSHFNIPFIHTIGNECITVTLRNTKDLRECLVGAELNPLDDRKTLCRRIGECRREQDARNIASFQLSRKIVPDIITSKEYDVRLDKIEKTTDISLRVER